MALDPDMTLVLVSLAVVMAALGGTLSWGVRRHDVAVIVNAVLSLVAVVVPVGINLSASYWAGGQLSIPLQLPLLIGVAGLLHMLGMIGWYDTVWWWDHVTHTVSAALIAAVVYAWLLIVGSDTPLTVPVDPRLATVGLTLLAGVVWELVEWALRLLSERLGIEGLLKHYGRFDTPLDILFDTVGAVLVVAVDVRLFVPAFAPIPEYVRLLLSGLIVALAVGCLLSVVVVAYGRSAW